MVSLLFDNKLHSAADVGGTNRNENKGAMLANFVPSFN
jgi:hypothetical protein